MHFMEQSAKLVRDDRRTRATGAIVLTARRFTAERGLRGFTVEDLCDEAGVSRRTFFNYFATKEDAVLGLPRDRRDGAANARFLAGTAGEGQRLSPTLVPDLVRLTCERWRLLDMGFESFSALLKALEREPQLLGRLAESLGEQGEFDARLIEAREGLPTGDLRAQVTAQVLGAISRSAVSELFSPNSSGDFVTIFKRRVAALSEVVGDQRQQRGVPHLSERGL